MKKFTAHEINAKKRTEDIFDETATDFESLLLSPNVIQGLKHAGFVQPSPIQLQSIPYAKFGVDLICQAKSGTGKTCVFAVCALEVVDVKKSVIQILALAPTREIAHQIHGVITTIGSSFHGLNCCLFIGGIPVEQDLKNLPTCHIAIGTPGRVKHLIENGKLSTESIRLFVLDEADKLLEEGSFQEQINWIYSTLPKEKQVLALSATYPESLANHLSNYMQDPVHVRINIGDLTLKGVHQYLSKTIFHPYPVKAFEEKCERLIEIIRTIPFQQCMVFSNFQKRAEHLSTRLCKSGWPSTFIAGSQVQTARIEAMDQLKNYNCRVLVTTDLTARGIDCDKVDLVINLDLPWETETYLHRVGRAGRFGSFGIAISIVSDGDEYKKIQGIGEEIGKEILDLPDDLASLHHNTDVTEQTKSVKCDDAHNSQSDIEKEGTYDQPLPKTSSNNIAGNKDSLNQNGVDSLQCIDKNLLNCHIAKNLSNSNIDNKLFNKSFDKLSINNIDKNILNSNNGEKEIELDVNSGKCIAPLNPISQKKLVPKFMSGSTGSSCNAISNELEIKDSFEVSTCTNSTQTLTNSCTHTFSTTFSVNHSSITTPSLSNVASTATSTKSALTCSGVGSTLPSTQSKLPKYLSHSRRAKNRSIDAVTKIVDTCTSAITSTIDQSIDEKKELTHISEKLNLIGANEYCSNEEVKGGDQNVAMEKVNNNGKNINTNCDVSSSNMKTGQKKKPPRFDPMSVSLSLLHLESSHTMKYNSVKLDNENENSPKMNVVSSKLNDEDLQRPDRDCHDAISGVDELNHNSIDSFVDTHKQDNRNYDVAQDLFCPSNKQSDNSRELQENSYNICNKVSPIAREVLFCRGEEENIVGESVCNGVEESDDDSLETFSSSCSIDEFNSCEKSTEFSFNSRSTTHCEETYRCEKSESPDGNDKYFYDPDYSSSSSSSSSEDSDNSSDSEGEGESDESSEDSDSDDEERDWIPNRIGNGNSRRLHSPRSWNNELFKECFYKAYHNQVSLIQRYWYSCQRNTFHG